MYVHTHVGTGSVINGMATVIIDGLACEAVYSITAVGRTVDGQIGPAFSYGTITTGPCHVTITPILSPSYGMN